MKHLIRKSWLAFLALAFFFKSVRTFTSFSLFRKNQAQDVKSTSFLDGEWRPSRFFDSLLNQISLPAFRSSLFLQGNFVFGKSNVLGFQSNCKPLFCNQIIPELT